ncbi:hypothetical protein [Proteiniclasticum sp.]|uniref:hypothetical protein n=1 Tax=Proteiniclasticum sp. TaxID=2053595 RepID=UPI002898147C|nr:hypothetical protein [Proteiniclasticum sp.]
MSKSDKQETAVFPYKRIVSGVLLSALLITGGCSLTPKEEVIKDKPSETQTEAYLSPFRQVNGPVDLNFMTVNKLREHYEETSDSSGFREMRLTISGLLDTKIEAVINEQISALHEKVKGIDLPPYRGIRRRLSEKSKLIDQYLATGLSFNYNNIISVSASGSKVFVQNGTEPGEFVEYTEVLNLDLNTGKEIRLSDLFVNDADYKDALNNRIMFYIEKEYSSDEYSDTFGYPKLIAPFKGVTDNQKFMLSENAIILIIDHETPEFETGLYYCRISIPFNDVKEILAIGERFKSNVDLYVDKKPVSKILITHYYKHQTGEHIEKTTGSVDIYSNYQYPPTLTSELQEHFKAFSELDDKEIARLNISSKKSQYYQNTDVSLIGKYTLFAKSRNISHEGISQFNTEFEVYDENSTIMTLEDVFNEQFDYEEYLKKILKREVPYQLKTQVGETDNLMKGISFRLNSDGIYFSTVPVKFSEKEIHPVSFSVEYDQIGYDHLMIFD